MKHSIKINDINHWMSTIAEIHSKEFGPKDQVYLSICKSEDTELKPKHIVSLACCLHSLEKRNIPYTMKEDPDNNLHADRAFGLWKVDDGTSSNYTHQLYKYLEYLNPQKDLTAVKMSMNEVIYNIFDHSESTDNAYLYTYYNYDTRRLEIAACDFGTGIAKLVRSFHPEITDDAAAIKKATEFAFTTQSRPHNGGIGLDNIISSCSENDEMGIISNKGQIIVKNNIMTTFALEYEFPGTLIYYEISISELPDKDSNEFDDVHF